MVPVRRSVGGFARFEIGGQQQEQPPVTLVPGLGAALFQPARDGLDHNIQYQG